MRHKLWLPKTWRLFLGQKKVQRKKIRVFSVNVALNSALFVQIELFAESCFPHMTKEALFMKPSLPHTLFFAHAKRSFIYET